MKSLLLILSLLVLCSTLLHAQRSKGDFNKLLPGLSEVNVKETVGSPTRVEPFYAVRTATKDTITFWVYPNMYTLVFQNHYLHRVEKNRKAFLEQLQEMNDPNNTKGLVLIQNYGR